MSLAWLLLPLFLNAECIVLLIPSLGPDYSSNLFKMRVPFVPPKPKEFDKA